MQARRVARGPVDAGWAGRAVGAGAAAPQPLSEPAAPAKKREKKRRKLKLIGE